MTERCAGWIQSDAATELPPARCLPAYDAVRGGRAWTNAWKSLDLDNALAPLQVSAQGERVERRCAGWVAGGRAGCRYRALRDEVGVPRVVYAYAEPSGDGRALTVVLAGEDAVGEHLSSAALCTLDEIGPRTLRSRWPGVIGLGILEGRWKARSGAMPWLRGLSGAEALAGRRTTARGHPASAACPNGRRCGARLAATPGRQRSRH